MGRRSKRIILFITEHGLETVLCCSFFFAALATDQLLKGEFGHLDWRYLLCMPIAFTGIAFLARALSQIPLCTWLRIRYTRKEPFSVTKSINIVAKWYPITFLVVWGIPYTVYASFYLYGPSPWQMESIDVFLNWFQKYVDEATIVLSIMILPSYLAALLAPALLYLVTGKLYESVE